MPDTVLILCTAPTQEIGEQIGRALVDGRLAACVNVLPPMVSLYRWKGELQRDSECQVLIKTIRARVEDVHAKVGELHPYDLPEFLVLAITGGDPAYLAWVAESSAAAGL